VAPMIKRVSHSLFGGRRGAVLMLLGVLFVLIGLQLIIQPLNPTVSKQLKYAFTLAPANFWGSVFILAGGISILSGKWKVFHAYGYGSLTLVSSGWAFFYFLSFASGTNGASRQFVTWLAISILVLIISGWPESPPTFPKNESGKSNVPG
jgi:hypothetical protein